MKILFRIHYFQLPFVLLAVLVGILFFTGLKQVKAEDQVALEKPKDFSGAWIESQENKYTVVLNWNAAEEYFQEDVEAYYSNYGYVLYRDNQEVYRFEPSDANNDEINFTESYNLNTGGIFFDSDVEKSKTYQYSLKAFDHEGNYSESVDISVKIFPRDETENCETAIEAGATTEEATDHSKIVKLNWDKFCGEDIDYKIYRDNNLIFTILASRSNDYYNADTQRMEYTDRSVGEREAKTYEYRIEAWGPPVLENATSFNLINLFIGKTYAADKVIRATSIIRVLVPGGNPPNPADPNNSPLNAYLNDLYTWIISLGAALTVLIIILGGYEYATSAGDVEKVNHAKEKIIGAIVGLILLLLAALILSSLGVAKI